MEKEVNKLNNQNTNKGTREQSPAPKSNPSNQDRYSDRRSDSFKSIKPAIDLFSKKPSK